MPWRPRCRRKADRAQSGPSRAPAGRSIGDLQRARISSSRPTRHCDLLRLTNLADIVREQSNDVATDHTGPEEWHHRPHGILGVGIVALDEVDDLERVVDERAQSLLWVGDDMLRNGVEPLAGRHEIKMGTKVVGEIVRKRKKRLREMRADGLHLGRSAVTTRSALCVSRRPTSRKVVGPDRARCAIQGLLRSPPEPH